MSDFGSILKTVGGAAGMANPLLGMGIQVVSGLFQMQADKRQAEVAEELREKETIANTESSLAKLTSKGGKLTGAGGVEVNPFAMNQSALGGPLSGNRMHDPNTDLEEYTQGGTHEENPGGGIKMGMGANGKPDTVEAGENSVYINGRKFIFSNRVPFSNKGEFPSFVNGTTPAEAAESINKAFENRQGTYDRATMKAFLERLAEKQEMVKELQSNTGLNEGESDSAQNQFVDGGFFPNYGNSSSYAGPVVNPAYNMFSRPGEPEDPALQLEEKGLGDPNELFPYTSQETAVGTSPQSKETPWWENDENISKAALGLGAVGSLAGVFGNIRASNKLKVPDKVNAHLLDTSSIQANLVNRQDMLRNIAGTQQSAVGALASRASGNFGAFAANVAGVQGKTAQAVSSAMMESDTLDARELARVQQLKLGAQQFNAQSQNQADLANEQNTAAYEAQRAAYAQGTSANISNLGKTLINYSVGTQAGKYGGLSAQIEALINRRK